MVKVSLGEVENGSDTGRKPVVMLKPGYLGGSWTRIVMKLVSPSNGLAAYVAALTSQVPYGKARPGPNKNGTREGKKMAEFPNTDQAQKSCEGGGGGWSKLWWPTNRQPRRCARQGWGWWVGFSALNAIPPGPGSA